ncbi:MAG: hypothetical protein ACUVYA_08525 [Planctomycetota bacterium]
MPSTETATKRTLCDACYESFPECRLVRREGRALCEACASRADGRRGPPKDSGCASSADPPCAARPAEVRAAEAEQADARPASVSRPAFLAGAFERSRGRSRALRLPLLVLLGYIFVRHLSDPEYQGIFKPLNLGIHELGHFAFAPFGRFLEIAGGSILQCLVPIAAMAMFLRQGDLFAVAVAFGWLGTNFYDVAWYAGDARAMAIPLVSPGGGPVIHDWNYLLGELAILPWDRAIASALRVAGTVSMAISLLGGAAILGVIFSRPGRTLSPGLSKRGCP